MREREHSVRGVHGGVWPGDADHAAAGQLLHAGFSIRRLRSLHRSQLLPHQHHTGGTDHAGEVHQCLRIAVAHSRSC